MSSDKYDCEAAMNDESKTPDYDGGGLTHDADHVHEEATDRLSIDALRVSAESISPNIRRKDTDIEKSDYAGGDEDDITVLKVTKTKVTPQESLSSAVFVSRDVTTRKLADGNTNFHSSSPESERAIDQQILRTTPGAFAINNPLSSEALSSSSNTARLPQHELRPSLRSSKSLSYSTSMTLQHETTPETTGASSRIPGYEEEGHPESSTSMSFTNDHVSSTLCFDAVFVANDSIVCEGRAMGEDENTEKNRIGTNDENKGKKRSVWCTLGSFIALLLVTTVAVGVGIVLNKQRRQTNLSTSNYSNSDASNSGVDVISNSSNSNDATASTSKKDDNIGSNEQQHRQKQEIRDYLISILLPISISGGASVFTENTRYTSRDRIEALEWLVDEVFTSGDDVTEILEWKLRQRYVMALLYTSTNGVNWDLQANFLSEDDECLWNEATPLAWLHTAAESTTTILDVIPDTTGVTCNEDGKVTRLMMRWNDMSGTLPHELSYLKNTLEEIDFGGGRISGTIPASWGLFTELKGLALDNNCLSGTISEILTAPVRLNVFNNPDLSGSLNAFCESMGNTRSDSYREGIIAVAGDCNVDSDSAIECDCCICCDESFQCFDPHSGKAWDSYNLNVQSYDLTIKSFNAECRLTVRKNEWIREECPCYTKQANNANDKSNSDVGQANASQELECTKDCDQEGAHYSSHVLFLL